MNIDKKALIMGIAAFVAAFLPMAAKDPYYVNIQHLGTFSYLLYAVPLAAIAIACVSDKVPFKETTVAVGITGALLTAATVWSGMQHLEFMASGLFRAMTGQDFGSTIPGMGGILAGASYIGLLLRGLLSKKDDK